MSVFVSCVCFVCGCTETPTAETESAETESTETESAESENSATQTVESAAATPTREGATRVPESWVTPRYDAAEARLAETSAGQLLWETLQAHGGLDVWLEAGTIEFDYASSRVGNPEAAKHTFQRIDLWSARAHHQVIDSDVELGFDGESAWIKPNAEAFGSSARFWALTPYYFVGMPFVLADPGVVLTQLEDAPLHGQTYDVVKASYEAGIGDSPGDYYILYLDKETHRMAALRYVVSSPGRFAPGEHSPEKLMMYTTPVEVGGLWFGTVYNTYTWDAEAGVPGEQVSTSRVGRLALGESYPDSIFAAPEGSVVDTGF